MSVDLMSYHHFKDVGHFPLTCCLYLNYISNMPGISPDSEHSVAGVPGFSVVPYYNITKSVIVPLTKMVFTTNCHDPGSGIWIS